MLYQKYDHNEQYPDKYAKKPVCLYLFCHDDIDESTRSFIYRDYLRDFMYEMEQVLSRRIIVELHYAIPGFTDMNYETRDGDESYTLDRIAEHAEAFERENGLLYRRTHKYGLITRNMFNKGLHGLARSGGSYFMASLKNYETIAHEIGHTFNATHKDAEVSFGVPPSKTYMYGKDNFFYINSYRFSDANRQNMQEFMESRD